MLLLNPIPILKIQVCRARLKVEYQNNYQDLFVQNYKVFYALKMLRTEFFARFQNVDSLASLICQVLYCLGILIQDQQSCPKIGMKQRLI